MSGTFQIDGALFPRDPLTKRWIRERAATSGPGEGVFIDLWRFEMSFGTLTTIGEHSFFLGKFLESGLHTMILPHPEDGSLQTFTGVAIVNYTFAFNDVDRDGWSVSPAMTLGGIPVARL